VSAGTSPETLVLGSCEVTGCVFQSIVLSGSGMVIGVVGDSLMVSECTFAGIRAGHVVHSRTVQSQLRRSCVNDAQVDGVMLSSLESIVSSLALSDIRVGPTCPFALFCQYCDLPVLARVGDVNASALTGGIVSSAHRLETQRVTARGANCPTACVEFRGSPGASSCRMSAMNIIGIDMAANESWLLVLFSHANSGMIGGTGVVIEDLLMLDCDGDVMKTLLAGPVFVRRLAWRGGPAFFSLAAPEDAFFDGCSFDSELGLMNTSGRQLGQLLQAALRHSTGIQALHRCHAIACFDSCAINFRQAELKGAVSRAPLRPRTGKDWALVNWGEGCGKNGKKCATGC
jgi:hypothetical protein